MVLETWNSLTMLLKETPKYGSAITLQVVVVHCIIINKCHLDLKSRYRSFPFLNIFWLCPHCYGEILELVMKVRGRIWQKLTNFFSISCLWAFGVWLPMI